MDPVTLFLIMLAGLFLLGAVGEIIFAKTQIPDVVWLILAGAILGPITGTVSREMLEGIAPYFAALTLIVVLFEGGSQLVLNDLIKAAPRASALAVLTFVITVVCVAAISMPFGALGVLEEWSLLKGIMLGAIVGGSSSLIIMPSMSLAKVEDEVASLVGLESALTDALCVVVTIAMIDVIAAGSGSVGAALLVLAKNFGIALGIGMIAGWMWMPVLRFLSGNIHAYPMTLAALILLYVVVNASGGSAAMGILAFAVMVGNAEPIMKKLGFSMGEKPLEIDFSVRTVHSQVSFVIKSFFFTFIGMMLSPPWSLLLIGVFFGVVLLAARVPGVWLATRGANFSRSQIKLITIALPRGMAAGVLATLPHYRGVSATENLPSMVFAAVITSILIFAVGFPLARRTAPAATPPPDPAVEPPSGTKISDDPNDALPAPGSGVGDDVPPASLPTHPGAAPAAPPAGAPADHPVSPAAATIAARPPSPQRTLLHPTLAVPPRPGGAPADRSASPPSSTPSGPDAPLPPDGTRRDK